MKYVKGLIVFVVVCFALYGAVMLFKKPPQLNVTEDERNYLRDMGIHIQKTEASDSGLSAVLGDVEGVEPIGVFASPSVSSSAPPSFFGDSTETPVSTAVPPPFLAEPVPKIAAPAAESPIAVPLVVEPPAAEPQSLSKFSSPSINPAVAEQPADTSSQTPASVEFPLEVHSVEPVPVAIPELEKTPFVTMPIESTVPVESPPVSAMESPPPIEEENWNGPVSWIPVTPPPAETLPYTTPLLANTASTPPHPEYRTDPSPVTNPSVAETKVRRIALDSGSSDPPADHSPWATDVEPLVESAGAAQPYVMTNVRRPVTFETMQPESSSNDPSISFAPSKHGHKAGQPDQHQAAGTLPPSANSGQKISAQAENREELRIVPDPSGVPKFLDQVSLKQFIQTQQMLAESGNPESIRTAFVRLSQFYDENRFDDSICMQVRPILNRLALDVIYSKDRHILEPPYQVKPGETVESISKNFGLTPALLRKINGLSPAQTLTAETMLKVVFGQFDARISVKRRELTLLLGGLYAGQFHFSTPPSINTSAYSGEFFIALRTGETLVLNNGLMIGRTGEKNAAFAVAEQDAREIFDILAEQSVIILE